MTTPDDNTPSDAVAEPVAPPPAAPVPVTPPSPQPMAAAPPAAYAPAPSKPNTWMNIVALVTGLLGMVVVPIIFGHLGVSASNKGTADLKGMGIAGLILGYLQVAFVVILIAFIVIGAAASSTS